MKVLLLTEFFPQSTAQFSGGVEARMYFLVEYLRKKIQLQIIANPQKNNVTANTQSLLPRLWFQITSTFKALQSQFDLIEGSNITTYIPAFIVGTVKGKPTIAWIPDIYGKTWFRDFAFLPGLLGYIQENIVLRLPWSAVIAMSQSTKQKLIQEGMNPKKITVIYGGVHVQQIQQLKVKPYKKPTITTLARLVNYKKVDNLISAIALLKEKYPDLTLRVLGDGPEKIRLEQVAQEKRVDSQVIFMGNQPHDQAMKILKRSWLFSLPSIVEGFGIVTAEAMAAGVPFVNSAIPPTIEITQNGQGGELFEPENVADLAAKIELLLSDKKRYKQKQKEAEKLVQQYDWEEVNRQTERVYRKVSADKK